MRLTNPFDNETEPKGVIAVTRQAEERSFVDAREAEERSSRCFLQAMLS
jgi:hypothetical protein